MPLELVERNSRARPVHLVAKGDLDNAGLDPVAVGWAKEHGFSGEAGRVLSIPGSDGKVAAALFGTGPAGQSRVLDGGALARLLPDGEWRFAVSPGDPTLAGLGLVLGSYVFTKYGKEPGKDLRFELPHGADRERIRRVAEGMFMARDLINTPANDLGPDALEEAARELAGNYRASISVTAGDDLLTANFPMIHAVGRASRTAPRLIDLAWGDAAAPKVTLVGKGVCFDTGGLDVKSSASMLLMKKDMGGAACVLGLASMIMAAGRSVRLRVLIPAVENAISGNAFRPGDVLRSRKGPTVEIGNTDAEGRLVLADALALADEEGPDLLVDMATLTGAARVALGPDLPPYYTGDDRLAAELDAAAATEEDPLWRMPLWKPYDARLSSKVADLNNVAGDAFAGSIIAALFLKRFVERAGAWAHFDVFGWNPADRPHGPAGGEAQAIRALDRVIGDRFG